MHYFDHLVFFLFRFQVANTLTFSEPSSRLSNATQVSLSNLTASSLLPTVALQCYPPGTAPPLDKDDCLSALNRFPRHPENARFRRGRGRGFYYLPLSLSQADCKIRIDLIDHVTEEVSSWREVYHEAASLIIGCVENRGGLGGNALVGNNLRIRVTVRYIDEAAGSNNNSTILSSRTPSSSPLSASVLYCYPPHIGPAPDLHDCLIALNRISDDPMRGLFHRGGGDDGFRLPVRYDHQTCHIFIDLVVDVQEELSSWLRVARDTQLLIFRCVQAGAHLGGYIFLGEQRRLRVTVDYIIQAAGGNNNSATILNDLERPIDR